MRPVSIPAHKLELQPKHAPRHSRSVATLISPGIRRLMECSLRVPSGRSWTLARTVLLHPYGSHQNRLLDKTRIRASIDANGKSRNFHRLLLFPSSSNSFSFPGARFHVTGVRGLLLASIRLQCRIGIQAVRGNLHVPMCSATSRNRFPIAQSGDKFRCFIALHESLSFACGVAAIFSQLSRTPNKRDLNRCDRYLQISAILRKNSLHFPQPDQRSSLLG